VTALLLNTPTALAISTMNCSSRRQNKSKLARITGNHYLHLCSSTQNIFSFHEFLKIFNSKDLAALGA
jgi:hypothetical protein